MLKNSAGPRRYTRAVVIALLVSSAMLVACTPALAQTEPAAEELATPEKPGAHIIGRSYYAGFKARF